MSAQDEDLLLLLSVAQGDQEALAKLYDRWADRLIGMGSRFIRQRHELEDVVHDVFLEIWKTAPDFDPARGLARTWIVMKMRCRLLDRLRRSQRRADLLDEHGASLHPSALLSPEAQTTDRELHALVAGLEEPLRQIVVMIYFQGRSSTEVAHALDVPIGTIKSRLARARQQLKDLYDGEDPA